MNSKSQFMKHVLDICKSTDLKSIGIKKYNIYEKQDTENPKWVKIILEIEFITDDINDNIKSWEDIRYIIDESISNLNIDDLDQYFYIQPIFK